AFYVLNRKQNNNIVDNHSIAVTSIRPIRPAGKKAMLTLANGKQIELSSKNSDVIAGVARQDSGKLVYKTSKKSVKDIQYNTLTTPRGGKYRIVLSDGTKVWLNAGSSLYYPVAFNGEKRIVKLTGE